jgi:transcriptional regulator with XRE-family HTH domain
MSRNQRLYDAIRQSGRRLEDIAEAVDADPKTVGRWITAGRLPRPAVRQKLARVVGVPEAVLWPDAPGVAYGTSELVGIYTTRRELPPSTISSLLDGAAQRIDVLAYSALWLWDTVPGFVERVQLKIARGAGVRICLGDPDSEAVLLRGREEGVDDALAGRCRLAITYARGIQHVDSDAVRLSAATLYASVFRFDDDLLLNTHLWGNAAGDSPVFHFRQQRDDGVAASAIRSFDRVWGAAQPLPVG